MGRNKKGKPTAAHEAEEVLSEASSAHSDAASAEEQPVAKAKVYHGNKLGRTAGGKAKKEGQAQPPPRTAAQGSSTEKDKAAEGVGANRKAEGNAVDLAAGLPEQLEEDLAVSRFEPVEVLYCPICTFPAEMCEYSGMYEQCRPWLLEHAKELAEAEERGRKRRALTERERLERLVQGRGTKKAIERIVLLELAQRKGRKMTTSVKGLDLFGFNLKDVSREWKKLFSCGAGVTSSEESKQSSIDIQGNVVAQLIELLPERYNIPKAAIYQMEEKKKVKCYSEAK
ncbi:uncharacterized protein Tco025E_06375 [Trypanosoma conorhini]|uniref:SUI1 domain-containing protein n=1 Tax=Trypanosoma conorhini TaxID=83891 RepID=A0A422P5I9_9TRYP|nr:uncharacterized protein Tco025E_06375 [Trypanosoma conorhini]RNF12987.1 hypothetical protein Tco025E_06375 [Trypanosoma conorhini]